MLGQESFFNGKLIVSLVYVLVCFNCANTNSTNNNSLISEQHLVSSNNGQTVSLKIGDTIDISLWGVFPGYGSPDVIGNAIKFIGDSTVGTLPGGPTIKYFFVAINIGISSISISDSTNNTTFAITCKVQ